jgi:hypothetical protein
MSGPLRVKKHVVFVVLFSLAETFVQISQRLRDNIEAYFLVSTQSNYRQLLAMGVANERILNVAKTRAGIRRLGVVPPDLEEKISEFEHFGPTFSSIIMMSRFFLGEDSRFLMHYMVLTAMQIEEFFLRNRVEWVIAEPTNAVELLTTVVAAKNGLPFGHIGFSRLPHNRLVLFQNIEERGFHPLACTDPGRDSAMRGRAETWLKQYREAPSRPAYFAAQASRRSIASLLRSTWRNLSLLFQGFTGANEVNYFRFFDLVLLYARPYFAYFKRRIITAEQGSAWKGRRPYAVYFLHVYPERSVDVIAPWFSNQLEAIRTIRRALPSNYDLLVKEHPSSQGGQPLSFYRQLRNIPNLYLLNAGIDSRTLIRNAAVVTTISGTTAYESALLKTPALIFSNVFFRKLPLVFRCTSPEELPQVMKQAIGAPRHCEPDQAVGFLADILANSVASNWDGSGGILPTATIDSFCELLMKAAAYRDIEPQPSNELR